MLLIADSGSTKTNWCYFTDENKTQYFSTVGINPFFNSADEIASMLEMNLTPKITGDLKQIHFYGAGIVNEKVGNEIQIALKGLFPAAHMEINSDLLAAARATLGRKKGIACILGTGSNSCLYDGINITEHVSPLGFILGDEGSGAVLGRKLVADYLKKLLPNELSIKFEKKYPLEYVDFLNRVYREEKPNTFLAQFVPFIKDDYCSHLVECSFDELISRNISQYSEYQNLPVCFVGSVAHHFREQLVNVLEKRKILAGIILQEPLEQLKQFHLNLI